jgi:hypothetical protein
MPEFTVKEVRMPELHLPEINRDEIVRTLSGVRIPEVDLAKARRTKIKVPTITLTADDVGRIIGAGAALTRFVKPTPTGIRSPWKPFGRRSRSPVARLVRPRTRRSRRPIVLGMLIVAVVAIWAILRRPATQRRLEAGARQARERFETWRAQDLRPEPGTLDDASASDADVLGLGSSTEGAGGPSQDDLATGPATDGVPAFEESRTPG